ncbi:hypothetical protein NDU88_004254 [Pleurodeles waltl]|uniref:Uncharacterized protein n=1 Tax=Pleurodeles waltl TaxID=8319 RepID=A0AAV7WW08_PLEWA|nr:hypothetical protein NDU88_004254 [Pleurodeles waltl]
MLQAAGKLLYDPRQGNRFTIIIKAGGELPGRCSVILAKVGGELQGSRSAILGKAGGELQGSHSVILGKAGSELQGSHYRRTSTEKCRGVPLLLPVPFDMDTLGTRQEESSFAEKRLRSQATSVRQQGVCQLRDITQTGTHCSGEHSTMAKQN